MENRKFEFEEVNLSSLSDEKFNNFPHKTVLTTKSWIQFIEEDSKATPLILKIKRLSDGKDVGFFSSLWVKKFGLKIIGSPFAGWSTPYMGFDVVDSTIKASIIPDLITFLRSKYKPVFIQISDHDISFEEAYGLQSKYGYIVETSETLELDVDKDDALLYKQMKTDCRNFINQFKKRGATIERAEPNDAFAEETYEHLIDVFAKQGLMPTWHVEKIKCLLKHLAPSESILCLRVRDPEGKSIATSMFPGFGKKFFYCEGASLRPYQHYRPNETMIYTAMKYWRDRGCTDFDMVGVRAYKLKFGSHDVRYPVLIIPKNKVIYTLKNWAGKLFYFMGGVKYKLHHLVNNENNKK